MILNLSIPPFDIGATRVGCSDRDARWHEQPFVIVREVTEQEWLDFCHREGATKITPRRLGDRFFEVVTD